MTEATTAETIVEEYLKIVEANKELPVYGDFAQVGISRDTIKHHYSGIERLHDYMAENHKEHISKHFFHVKDIFSPERSAATSSKNTYVVTTAVAGARPHIGFLDAIDNFCNAMNAQAVIMPCESITNSFENKSATFDPLFNDKKYKFVIEDTALNTKIHLCSIQVSAKQIKPITGLSRLGNREGSYVFASPKQFLEYVPSGHEKNSNYSIMTTGACTEPRYYSEAFVSKRLSYIAERDHTMGAIIIEIQDDKIFHFRQIQCAEDGSFIDLGIQYNPDGTKENVTVNVIFGDIHGINRDEEALSAFVELVAPMEVDNVFLHDIFDGYSISHHVTTISERTMRTGEGRSSLVSELLETYAVMEEIDNKIGPNAIRVVKSNHDEFLSRYLENGRYVDDPENHYSSLKIATALFESEDCLARGFDVAAQIKEPELFDLFDTIVPPHWHFHTRNDSLKIAGVECLAHGDLGLNGARPSLNSLEVAYGDCVVGHNHSAAIQRGVFRVGTLSKLDMKYNKGPSSWTHTSCLLYPNGQRQLINYIGGNCKLPRGMQTE